MVARRIADAVALAIRDGSLPTRTAAFAQLVAKAKGKEYQKMHPAKMTFQALRIQVRSNQLNQSKCNSINSIQFLDLVWGSPLYHSSTSACTVKKEAENVYELHLNHPLPCLLAIQVNQEFNEIRDGLASAVKVINYSELGKI